LHSDNYALCVPQGNNKDKLFNIFIFAVLHAACKENSDSLGLVGFTVRLVHGLCLLLGRWLNEIFGKKSFLGHPNLRSTVRDQFGEWGEGKGKCLVD